MATVRGDRAIAQDFYQSIMEKTWEPLTMDVIHCLETVDADTVSWDPELEEESERLIPT